MDSRAISNPGTLAAGRGDRAWKKKDPGEEAALSSRYDSIQGKRITGQENVALNWNLTGIICECK